MPCEYTPTRSSPASREADGLEDITCPGDRLLSSEPEQAAEEDKVLETGKSQVEGAVTGRDEANRVPERTRLHIEAKHAQGARRRRDEAAQDSQQSRLAGAVRAQQSVYFTARRNEIHVLKGYVARKFSRRREPRSPRLAGRDLFRAAR